MKISNLDQMEKIVKSNPNLFWEGWDVCTYVDEDGFYETDGAYNGEKWMRKKRFELSNGKWEIPDRLMKNV